MCRTEEGRLVSVSPRWKMVTVCPRSSRPCTMYGPVRWVPPTMRTCIESPPLSWMSVVLHQCKAAMPEAGPVRTEDAAGNGKEHNVFGYVIIRRFSRELASPAQDRTG